MCPGGYFFIISFQYPVISSFKVSILIQKISGLTNWFLIQFYGLRDAFCGYSVLDEAEYPGE